MHSETVHLGKTFALAFSRHFSSRFLGRSSRFSEDSISLRTVEAWHSIQKRFHSSLSSSLPLGALASSGGSLLCSYLFSCGLNAVALSNFSWSIQCSSGDVSHLFSYSGWTIFLNTQPPPSTPHNTHPP